MRLKKLMVAAVEKIRDAQSILASVKTYEMQREQLVQQEQIKKQLQMLIDKQENTEQLQKNDVRVSRERRPFAPSDAESTNIGEGTATGEDSPIERNINGEDSTTEEEKQPAGKQTVVKGDTTREVEATSEEE